MFNLGTTSVTDDDLLNLSANGQGLVGSNIERHRAITATLTRPY